MRLETVSDQAATHLQRARRGTIRWLQSIGLLPTPPHVYEEMEGAVRGALSTVRAPNGFRQQLGRDLELAARSKHSGLRVESPPPLPRTLIWGAAIFVTLLAATTALLIVRTHPNKA